MRDIFTKLVFNDFLLTLITTTPKYFDGFERCTIPPPKDRGQFLVLEAEKRPCRCHAWSRFTPCDRGASQFACLAGPKSWVQLYCSHNSTSPIHLSNSGPKVNLCPCLRDKIRTISAVWSKLVQSPEFLISAQPLKIMKSGLEWRQSGGFSSI